MYHSDSSDQRAVIPITLGFGVAVMHRIVVVIVGDGGGHGGDSGGLRWDYGGDEGWIFWVIGWGGEVRG